jgi:hypothetical protein
MTVPVVKCSCNLWAVLAAFRHWLAGLRSLVTLTPMSLSSSETPRTCPFMRYSCAVLLCPRCITTHFLTLNSIPHCWAHSHSLSSALCRFSFPSCVAVCPSLVSSANFFNSSINSTARFQINVVYEDCEEWRPQHTSLWNTRQNILPA